MANTVEFSIHNRGMVCGSSEAESRMYKMFVGKSGKRWLVAIQANLADNIYVQGDKNSDGFAGRTLDFRLETGETVSLKGPWHSSAEALFNDTGYDVRNKCLTMGIVAEDVEPKFPTSFYSGVIHLDNEWTLGHYDRIQDIAQEAANRLKKPVAYAFISTGGGSSSWVEPNENI